MYCLEKLQTKFIKYILNTKIFTGKNLNMKFKLKIEENAPIREGA